ncbi:hypothetical protein [Thermus sp.]
MLRHRLSLREFQALLERASEGFGWSYWTGRYTRWPLGEAGTPGWSPT